MDSRISLDDATELTRTGDIWLFRGAKAADRAIQLTTNSPINHVGMAIVIEDLPPLMWHAELGRSLPDMWSGTHHRGVQLHDLREAVLVWARKYGQRAWLRQLDHPVTREMRRGSRELVLETAYCAEVVAVTYEDMGLLRGHQPNWYDPGRFWSGDDLKLAHGARLGAEIAVDIPD